MVLQFLRSLVFYALFLGQTIILAIIIGVMAMFNRGWFSTGWALARYWAASNLVFLRFICGIRTKVSGMENIPEGGCIIVAKHQSDWDIFALLPHVGRPAFIAKRELMDIPFFGRAAKSFGTISIDRQKGSQAIPQMTDEARAAIKAGHRIIIFPEGTRKAPFADPDYRFGAARLYTALNVPVVPVALNSGLFWGRNSLILWPGRAEAKFLAPIAPGLSAGNFHTELMARIETGSNALMIEAIDKGIARPLPPDMREKYENLRTKTAL